MHRQLSLHESQTGNRAKTLTDAHLLHIRAHEVIVSGMRSLHMTAEGDPFASSFEALSKSVSGARGLIYRCITGLSSA